MANDRILQGINIPLPQYLCAVLNLTEELTRNLTEKLKKEGRWSGLAKSYVHSMWEAFSYTNEEITEEEEEVFQRLLWLMKKTINHEYNSLTKNKRLSEGDSMIVLLKRTFEIILEKAPEGWEYTRRVKTLLKLIDKFFTNIRNPKKSAKLFSYSDFLKGCIEKGSIGKRTLLKLNIPENLGRSMEMIEILETPGNRLEGVENKIIEEMSW